jgi:hypothetical protein
MKIKTISFVAAVAVAAVFAGCEWTSSDGDPTWSGSYNEGGETVAGMNFSGTYRNDARGGCAVLTKDGSSSSSTPIVSTGSSTTISQNVWQPNSSTVITLPSTPTPGSVAVSATVGGNQLAWTNDGSGNLVGSSGIAGSGKVDGNTVTLRGYKAGMGKEGDKVTVTYTPQDTSSAPVVSGNGAVLAITVSQSGSNLKLHTSNGVTMSGAITTVSVYSNATSVTYNAQFTASSGNNSIVGTLDDRTGQNRIDATWTSGASIYDVNGFCGTGSGL